MSEGRTSGPAGRGVALAPREALTTARYDLRPAGTRPVQPADPVNASPARTPRRLLAPLAAVTTLLCLLQQPGKIAADTKLDVVLDPARFLSAALHLWRADADFGFVQNQAAGYFFPMGPFFLIGKDLGIPPWITQRLWWALLLTVALWGVVRLADALRIGRPWTRCAAGVAFALSPFFLGQIGATSAALTGAALLPWMLLPLVLATRPDPRGGDVPRLTARRAAALSGLAVFASGGVNASVTLCVLIAPGVWLLLCAGRGRPAWTLRLWWALSVALACAWWALALSAQGKYGLDFLAYTETPQTTTAFSPITHILGGTDNWLYFLQVPSPWLPAGWAYIVRVPLILSVAGVATAGVFGLARRDLPIRRYLLVVFSVGVLAVGLGYSGTLGGPFHSIAQSALNAPFGAFRNVWKFQPLVMLPLALGIAHGLAVFRVPRRIAESRPEALLVRTAPRIVAVGVVLALIGSAAPLIANKAVRPGAFTGVPGYWQQAADWLGRSATGGRTLMLPGEGFGEYSWGRPLDEPMQWLSKTPWAARSLIPLGNVGTTRLLDGIEQQLTIGSAAGLDSVLQRSGIGYVLVRNDYGTRLSDTPPSSAQVHRALSDSGLRRVAQFGPIVPATPAPEELLVANRKPPATSYPSLEVFAVPGAKASFANAYPTSTAAVVSGGPEVYPQLAEHDALASNRASVLAADLPKNAAARPTGPNTTWIDTDSLGRRDTAFGQVHQGQSYLLGATERVAGTTTDPRQRLDPQDKGHQTVAVYDGAAGVTASSYGFLFFKGQSAGPSAAVDGDERTFWQALVDPKKKSTGAWLQINLNQAIPVSQVAVRLLHDGPWRPDPQAIRVTTEAGSVDTEVRADEALQVLKAPGGATRWVRVTFTKLTRQTNPSLGAGIRELTIPGVVIRRDAAAPSDVATDYRTPATGSLTYVFDRYRGDSTSPFSRDEEVQLARSFTVPREAVLRVSGTAVPLPTLRRQAPRGWNGRSSFQVPCGAGPDVVVDGTRYQTRITVTAAELKALQPVPLGLCAPGARVDLGAGKHEIHTEKTQGNALIDGLVLRSDQPAAARPATNRTTGVGTWGPEHRSLTIGAGVTSYLAVHESFNASWTATLDGKPLQPVQLDGWQQGYVVPAGHGGTVLLTNTPGESYRRTLIVGAGLVVLLFLLVLIPARRRRDAGEPVGGSRAAQSQSGAPTPTDETTPVSRFTARAAAANRRDVVTALRSGPGANGKEPTDDTPPDPASDGGEAPRPPRARHRAKQAKPARRWPPSSETSEPVPPAEPSGNPESDARLARVLEAVRWNRAVAGNGGQPPTNGDGPGTRPADAGPQPTANGHATAASSNGASDDRPGPRTNPQPIVRVRPAAIPVAGVGDATASAATAGQGGPERLEIASMAVAALVVGLIAGPALLVVPVLWLLCRSRVHLLPWIAAGGMLLAGLLAALSPGSGPGADAGAFGWPAQVLGGAVLASILLTFARRTGRPPVDRTVPAGTVVAERTGA